MDFEKIISEMTLEEKFQYLTGAGMNHTCGLPRFGIDSMRLHDGPFGLRMKVKDEKNGVVQKIRSAFPNSQGGEEVVSTAFPTGAAIGAAWDPELVFRIGQALGEECRMYGVQAILGPAMNIKRHPLCGRNFEYFSEDPVLTEKLAEAYVEGVQSQGVAACPKHFALNNQERGRFAVSSEVDERTMREIYLRAFEGMVKHAAPWSIMCAYNRINGIFASEHRQLMQDILREEWGFDGIIISDWGAVKNRAYSLLASIEMCMPYQEEAYGQLQEAYDKRLIDDEVVDEALRHLFRFYERTTADRPQEICDFEQHHELALQAAREAIVLLKNENHVLPLKKEVIKKVLVLGETAVRPFIGGDGSSRVASPYKVCSPLDELKDCLGQETQVKYLGDSFLHTYENEVGVMEGKLWPEAVWADALIVFASQDYSCYSEAMDRNSVELDPYMEYVIESCHRTGKRVIVVLNIGSAVSTWKWKNYADAILVSWTGGQAMGRAVAETLCGINNPSGKLAETFPRRLQDAPGLEDYPGDGCKTVYQEGIMTGYRHYDKNRILPDYEFGFGLSYSSFSYSEIMLEGNQLSFYISNDSDRDGDEIAQIYVQFPDKSWVSHPPKELKAFQRIHLKARERKKVEIEISEDFFTYYNIGLKRWTTEAGTYTILVGGSSSVLPLKIETSCTGPEGFTLM
ncbi:MAG: glycoside hydrolase family 3 C-terminal domain-containing protein [Oliverpabstia sp.]